MRKAIMILLAMASPAHPAIAQVSGQEYLAAYCLGVVEQRGKGELANSLGEGAVRQEAEFLGRIKRHLQIKLGTKTPAPQLQALFAAKQKGTIDQSDCTSEIEASSTMTSAQCIEKCRAPIPDYELCFSCIAIEVEAEACKRVAECKPAPLPQLRAPEAVDRAPPSQPAPTASQAKQQSFSDAPSQSRPRVASAPASSQPGARPPLAASSQGLQEVSRDVQAKPAGQCMVSRPKPGLQVYTVRCPSSWVTIGRTVDLPTDWTVSEGVNSNEAIEFFMKSRMR
jgi:hypothetical protein